MVSFLIVIYILAVSSVSGQDAETCIEWGRKKLDQSLRETGYRSGSSNDVSLNIEIHPAGPDKTASCPEGFHVSVDHRRIEITGYDAPGAMYGGVELAERVRSEGNLPESLEFSDSPLMHIRGT